MQLNMLSIQFPYLKLYSTQGIALTDMEKCFRGANFYYDSNGYMTVDIELLSIEQLEVINACQITIDFKVLKSLYELDILLTGLANKKFANKYAIQNMREVISVVCQSLTMHTLYKDEKLDKSDKHEAKGNYYKQDDKTGDENLRMLSKAFDKAWDDKYGR